MRLRMGVLLVLTAWATALADDPAAPLLVREPVGVAREAAPVTGGVPVGPFRVTKTGSLGLFDAAGRPVACQIVPTVVAPDGTVTWVLVDFQTDLKANEVREFTLRRVDRAKPAVTRKVTVEPRADSLTITTGPLKAVISTKAFDLFDQVWVDRNGDGRFADDERMLRREQKTPPALVLVDAVTGKTFTTRQGVVHKVTLEDSGPLRTTIRLDGAHGAEGGGTYLKYTARLTFWAGSPSVKLLYSIRNTNRKAHTAAKIRRATVTVNLITEEGATHYLLGAASPRLSRLDTTKGRPRKPSQRHHIVALEQRGPDRAILSRTDRATFHMGVEFDEMGFRVLHSQPSGRTRYADCGLHCGGWLDLGHDQAGGCLLWLRNFTQNPLKRLRADAEGRIDLDLIPEYDGSGQMFYRGGGFWITDSAYRTYEMAFHFHGRPLVREADWKKWALPMTAYGEPTPETARRCEALVASVRDPLVLVCDPRWYSDTGTLCGPIPSVADETRVNRMRGRTKEGPVRPHRQEALGTEFLPRENYHWRSESDEPRDCLIQHIRLGEYEFLKRAHSFARVARDMGVFRCDGKALGQRPGVEIARDKSEKGMTGTGWGSTKMCDCHNYGAGLVDLWLVTGDRSYLDAAVDNAENAIQGKARPVGPRVSRGWSRMSAGLLRVYEVTGDPRYRAHLLKTVYFPSPEGALRAQGLGVLPGQSVGSWMHVIAAYAVWRSLALNGDAIDPIARDDSRDRLIAWARTGASTGEPARKPKTKTGYGLCSLATIMYGYELTGDRKILEAAGRIWARQHKLGDDVVDARLRDWGPSSGANLFWARYVFENYAHPRTDDRPPVAVSDLAAEALGGGKVRLTWTAPQEEGGKVAEYQLKHAARPIVTWDVFYDAYPAAVGKKASWFGAYNVAGEPKPAPPGTKQSMVIEAVPAGVRYFRIRAWDDSSNQGLPSNEVKVDVR